ncbi:MAG: hypothetical protein MZV64_64410 [Ignavibacteriales bacterium]|nr:hypothetical protein [Ignavibacteriales bacterium]
MVKEQVIHARLFLLMNLAVERKKAQDVWNFGDKPYPSYPTEKNIDFAKYIIANSSNENSKVLDSFWWIRYNDFLQQLTWVGIGLVSTVLKKQFL